MPRTSSRRTGLDETFYTPPPGTPPFNLNTPSHGGQGPYGTVPGAIGLPPVYNDIAGVFPGLTSNIDALSKNISSELAGELDPQTIAMLQNTAAQFGIGAGVPLSPFSGAAGLRHLGKATEDVQAQGGKDLLSALPTIAKTLTVSPETQLDVANRNATLNAAPDPRQAALEAQRLFDLYLAKTQRGGGGSLSYSPGPTAPRNLNAGATFSPWGTSPVNSFQGTLQQNPYQGILGGTQRAPQDLWGGDQGPELGQSWNWPQGPELGQGNQGQIGDVADWFNWDQNPTLPDFPEWGD